ncbi:acyl-CoA dehydratase activase, partial [Bacteroidota bacterium]
AICDSLCKGLAKNITDTLFSKNHPVLPILFVGGVSKNDAVIKHLEQLLETRLLQHDHSHIFGAIGACLLILKEEKDLSPIEIKSLDEILDNDQNKREYYYEPLSLKLSKYPDFKNQDSYLFTPIQSLHSDKVQVDLYNTLNKNTDYKIYLGIDIGSTSTKAIIIHENKEPLVGFYTYTAGNPLRAVKSIYEAIDNIVDNRKIKLSFLGVGTTGSGRKFIGKIIRADSIIDEITAHARAAYELNPKVDTIIEIGGQDAKFTIMHGGIVTFSQMNTVCAAGTGSFIEEQAKKLNCPLSEYSKRAENVRAPYASDRCTVFMERDINQLLNMGFSVNETLATALHSVTENYLKKVATEASIGENICFQGATAKNRSLVAAFEQKLKKEIFVSKYCHLTGALGVAILLREEHVGKSNFRGLNLYKEVIPVKSETCLLCANNCHISIAEVMGEKEAYGFLCGRDYTAETPTKKLNKEFNLIVERKKILSEKQKFKYDVVIGLPASLNLFEELILWKRFLNNLSIRTITSENFTDSLKTGKRIAGAEFCAPVDSMFGHAAYLANKVDYIFIPVFLESREKPKDTVRNFCYYTQFSSSLIYSLKDMDIQKKCLSPLIDFNKGSYYSALQLLKCLKPILKNDLNYFEVSKAYDEAVSFYEDKRKRLTDLFDQEFNPEKDLSVVLLGRPYIVLSKTMNKGIPDILSNMGVKTFYQDMINSDFEKSDDIKSLLKKVPWHYAAQILEKAKVIATTKNLYPVLITAFKCAPDSFIIEYFKKILNKHHKPYLILQIDEHDSNVGYETRIEAAIRSFKNHSKSAEIIPSVKAFEILPHIESQVNGKTLLFPSWDSIVSPLIVANLKRTGIDAQLMESSEMIIKKSMAHNTGQCLPLNIITQEYIDYVEKYSLNPENTILWMIESKLSCNLRFYSYYMKSLLENYGNGFEKSNVYSGPLTHLEFSLNTCYYAYFAYMIGGLIRKISCKIRPYETIKGATDTAIDKSVLILEEAFLGKKSMDEAVSEAIVLFDKIEKSNEKRPKVAIFGDFYVRDNDLMNQELIHAIENAGGEVITTPYNDLVKITIENILRRALARGSYSQTGLYKIVISIFKLFDEKYYNKHFKKYFGKQPVINPKKLEKHLDKFNINLMHSGESYENILKVFYILENYPDVSLFVQTNPAYCCPSLVTEAMTNEIKRITGVPVVTITYDGTSEYKNDIIIPYLQSKKNVT